MDLRDLIKVPMEVGADTTGLTSNAAKAINIVLAHEGGWVDNKNDLGGETNYGWSMYTIRNLGLKPRDLGIDQDEFTPGCLKKMPKSAAIRLYRDQFWTKYGYGSIGDWVVATKIMDCAVNCGPARAAIIAQRTCNVLAHAMLKEDGRLGPVSYGVINALPWQDFVREYGKQMAEYYRAIVETRPKNAEFLSNWLKRASWPGEFKL